jgi:hypothetical protein
MYLNGKRLFTMVGLGVGSFVAGPIGACIGSLCGSCGAEFLSDWLENHHFEIGTDVGEILRHLFVTQFEQGKREPSFNGFKLKFREGLLLSLLNSVRADGVANTVLQSTTYRAQSGSVKNSIQAVFSAWELELGKMLKSQPQSDDGWFFPEESQSKFVALVASSVANEDLETVKRLW